jgi:predicted membrane protein DUF2231
MFDTIAGLPLHPLIIHVVVIVLPLACAGAIALAVVPVLPGRHGRNGRWDRRWDRRPDAAAAVVLGVAALAALAAVVATQSGQALASRVGVPVDHQSVARWVQWAALLLVAAVAGLWWADRRPDRSRPAAARLRATAAAVTVLAAVVALGLVIAAGHSGATAVWGPIVANTTVGSVPVG